MASIQRRKGPNVTGLLGLGQPVADGFKLIVKEILYPVKSEKNIFVAAPLVIITLSLTCWSLIPGVSNLDATPIASVISTKTCFFDIMNVLFLKTQFLGISFVFLTTYSLLYLLAISSLNVYGIIAAGWASYSKYAFIGSQRSSAQLISYEVSISLILLPLLLLNTTFNFTEIILNQKTYNWSFFFLLPLAGLFLVSILAETNRTPFDLPEAEAELVAGYNVEYSSITFAMFFLGEYSNMILMSLLYCILFFGGWFFIFSTPTLFYCVAVFAIKTISLCFIFVLIRALVPRYKYNQLMNLGWKLFLPWSISIFCLIFFFFTRFCN